jgi:DNA polymerase-3 subunit gamma/tau
MRQAKLRPSADLQRLFRVAQVGTEEVRKSALPKLVLEMTLVKMATMPDAPPIDELLARLEEMERRLAGGGGGEPPGGRGAEGRGRASAAVRAPMTAGATTRADAWVPPPAVEAARAEARAVEARSAAGAVGSLSSADGATRPTPTDGARGWPAFVAAAQGKGLRMFLLGSRVLEESGDRLHIGLATELAEQTLRQHMSMLAELAAAAYGGPRRIELSVVHATEPSSATPASAAARARELDERARSSPTVRSAVEVLGGEITDVRPRSRGGEP